MSLNGITLDVKFADYSLQIREKIHILFMQVIYSYARE